LECEEVKVKKTWKKSELFKLLFEEFNYLLKQDTVDFNVVKWVTAKFVAIKVPCTLG